MITTARFVLYLRAIGRRATTIEERDQIGGIKYIHQRIIVDIRGDKVRIGVKADRSIPVNRREIHEDKCRAASKDP